MISVDVGIRHDPLERDQSNPLLFFPLWGGSFVLVAIMLLVASRHHPLLGSDYVNVIHYISFSYYAHAALHDRVRDTSTLRRIINQSSC